MARQQAWRAKPSAKPNAVKMLNLKLRVSAGLSMKIRPQSLNILTLFC
jgi:hypothetical protein